MVVNDRGGAASVAPLSVVKSDNRATLTGQVLVCFHGSCSVSAISPSISRRSTRCSIAVLA